MLKKIDCVMIKVSNPKEASIFYKNVLGLIPICQDSKSIGMNFPDSDTEIVLHSIEDIPSPIDVNYLVDNVDTAIQELEEKGCKVIFSPFEIEIGKCAVIQDPFGINLSILDMTKGERK